MLQNNEPIDKFIDELIEWKETKKASSELPSSLHFTIQQKYESCNLPPIDLHSFDGVASKWPQFIEDFYRRDHRKITFDDNMRMTRLLSVLHGDVKKAVFSIENNGIFYATALKTLKRDFGNPLLVSHKRLSQLFNRKPISSNDKLSLRQFHQELKQNSTWLLSIGYETPLLSYENLSKAIATLPHNLRQDFFKATRSNNLLDGSINLIGLADWLDGRLKTYFNPLAEIVVFQDQENLSKLRYNTNTGKSKLNNSLTLNTLNLNDHSDDEDKLVRTNQLLGNKGEDENSTAEDKTNIEDNLKMVSC